MIGLPSRVLVTNFSYKNALAAVRSLGRAGTNVVVGGRDPKRARPTKFEGLSNFITS